MGYKLPSRTRTRSQAVDVLYEAYLKDLNDSAGIYSLAKLRETETTAQTPMPSYARKILEDVVGHLDRIDAALATYSHIWSLHRILEANSAIVRVVTWETLFDPDVDGPVAIITTMQLAAGRFTDGSPKFISSLLGTINDTCEVLVAQDMPKTDSDTGTEIPESTGTPVGFDVTVKAVRDYAHQEGGMPSRIDLENLGWLPL